MSNDPPEPLVVAMLESEPKQLRQTGPDASLAAVRSAEAEDHLQAILDSATDFAIFTTNEHGIVTSWNEGAWRVLGWHEDEIVGQDGAVIFTPEDRDKRAPKQEMETASAKGRAEDERWHLRKDGSRFWASGVLMPLRKGSPGFLKILQDRTEQLHAERNQTRRLEQMKALAQAARTIMGASDLSMTLQAITDAARDIIGAHQAVCSMTRRGSDWSQAINAVSLTETYAAWRNYDRMPDGSGIYAWLCEANRTARMTQAELEAHPRWRGFGEHGREHPPMRGWLATALTGSDGCNLGLIQLSDKVEGEFDEADESIIVQLAQFAASAIERAQAEEERRANAEFTNRILEASGDCIKVLDLDARLQFMSTGGQVVMEVDDFEQIRGCPWPEFWSGPDRDAATTAVEAARAGGVGRFQGFTPTAKGTPRWWDVVLTPINGPDGRPERLLSVSRDITKERLAQEALSESEARFRTAADSSPALMWMTDDQGEIVFANQRYKTFFGVETEAMLGDGWRAIVHPEDVDAFHEAFRAAFAAHEPFHRSVRVNHPTLGVRWLSCDGRPRYGAEGEFQGYVGVNIDGSEAVVAERALREAQAAAEREAARTAAILAQLAEGVVVTDTSGRITFVNEAAAHIHGVEKLDVSPQDYTETYHLFTEEGFPYPSEELPLARAVLQGETVSDARWRIRRPDGQEVIAVGSARPVLEPSGERAGAVLTLRDATARVMAEAALRESEARFRGVAEAMPGFVWTADAQGNLDYTSPRWHAYSGLHPQDSNGQGWASSVHPEDQPLALARWSAAVSTRQPYETEFRLRRADGVYRWWLARALPSADPTTGALRWIGVCTELEDIIAARETLARSREELEHLVEERTAERDRMWRLSQDMLAVFSADGVVLSANPAWTRTLGWRVDEIEGRHHSELKHPDDLVKGDAGLARLGEGRTVSGLQDRYRHKDGGYRWLSWTAAPQGGLIYAAARDITAERERQAELAAAQEQLRQAQKMEAVGQLTGGVAHDFNNLLTIIRSSVDFLHRPNLPEERRRRYIDAISETVTRAAKLTSQLLAFARRQALRPEVFDVAERIRSVSDMLRTIVGTRIPIVTEITCQPCFVEADVGQFETALVNMAVNARDAMEGEGRLIVRLSDVSEIPAIRAHTRRPGRFVAVSLTDTGSGIPPDKLSQIFEPFFTTKEVGKGTGLGLSQVFGFAKQSGGDVEVKSELGRGTTFTLFLPQADRKAAAEGAEPGADRPEPAESGQGRRVLVVEDNVEVGQFATQVLQDLGYETVWAANADEALKVLEAERARFDVVFSDVVMPGMSGMDLGHEVRRRYPGLPIVLTTGYSHVLVEEGLHGFELLQKPYAAEEVSRVLRRVTQSEGHKGGQ